MMKNARLIVAAATIAFGVAVVAQAPKASPLTVPSHPLAFTQNQNNPAPALSTFTGTINKSGDAFIFTDESSKSSYKLDDQQSAGKFDGKKVKIIGTLDATNNTIRVQSIEAATA
jgi:uncharacterized protein YdeI (BOF family)